MLVNFKTKLTSKSAKIYSVKTNSNDQNNHSAFYHQFIP
jgi:hypothetical protein